MSYRDRQDIYGPATKTPDPKAMRWALLAVVAANLGPLLGHIFRHYGVHAGRTSLTIGALALCAVCVVGGVMAYRDARRSAARHVAELTGEIPPDEAPNANC